jgi:hypothetical protein
MRDPRDSLELTGDASAAEALRLASGAAQRSFRTGMSRGAGDAQGGAASDRARRSFLGVHFKCCGVYARIYRNREGTAYLGYCPKCAKRVRAAIGPGGTGARFFTAD